jgi:hypothetical protein
MLQMKCPKCLETINSPFLIELGAIECEHCHKEVKVGDVFVTTKNMSMHRDALLKRLRNYRLMLHEMEKERNVLQKNQSATNSEKESKRNTNSQKSLDQHYAALRELLEAARDNYRLSMTEGLSVKLEVAGGQPPAELINISTRGAAVKISESPKPPVQNAPVKLHLSLPDIKKTYLIEAKVVWVQPDPSGAEGQFALGLKFLNPDKALQQRLFQHIYETYKKSSV